MFTSLDQSLFPAHWCADYSKTCGFRAGGISKSLYPFSSRLCCSLVGSAAKTLFRVRVQSCQLRRLVPCLHEELFLLKVALLSWDTHLLEAKKTELFFVEFIQCYLMEVVGTSKTDSATSNQSTSRTSSKQTA